MSSFAYTVRLYSHDGILLDELDTWRSLTIEHQVNHFSTLTISMHDDPTRIANWVKDNLVVIKRRSTEFGIDWYDEYKGFHRTPQHEITEDGRRIFTSYGRGLIDLLNRRAVRWKADTAGSDKGPAPADDIMKEFVRENAGSLALVSLGRETDGVFPNFTVSADVGAATSWRGARAWQNLLEVLQKMSEETRQVEFDVVGTIGAGAVNFDFRTYVPQLGTDRRVGVGNPPVIFTPEYGDVAAFRYSQPATEEVTSVLALGDGQGIFRNTAERISNAINDSPWNYIESNHDASQEEDTEGLQIAADGELAKLQAKATFDISVLQQEQSAYGKHYFLGDICTAAYGAVSFPVRIDKVSIVVSEGKETINVGLKELSSDAS